MLSVTATGSPTLTFQWRLNGSDLPGENGPVALVKLYDGLADTIKLNDVLEVYGVISTDPSLALLGANE